MNDATGQPDGQQAPGFQMATVKVPFSIDLDEAKREWEDFVGSATKDVEALAEKMRPQPRAAGSFPAVADAGGDGRPPPPFRDDDAHVDSQVLLLAELRLIRQAVADLAKEVQDIKDSVEGSGDSP